MYFDIISPLNLLESLQNGSPFFKHKNYKVYEKQIEQFVDNYYYFLVCSGKYCVVPRACAKQRCVLVGYICELGDA